MRRLQVGLVGVVGAEHHLDRVGVSHPGENLDARHIYNMRLAVNLSEERSGREMLTAVGVAP